MFKNDDILVSLTNTKTGRLMGDIILITNSNSYHTSYIYGNGNYCEIHNSNYGQLRSATLNEIKAYNKGIRNIKDIIKELEYEIY